MSHARHLFNELEASRLPGLSGLAKVIRDDLPAVVEAITSPYSSGVNEGRITDVKLQKRLIAGQAKGFSAGGQRRGHLSRPT